MEVRLCVKSGTDVSLVEAEFGELSGPYPWDDEEGLVDYYLGNEDEEDEESSEWLTHDDAVRFCGFCDGAIPESIPWIMGNGDWAQNLIGCRDFSRYAMAPEDKVERLRVSEIYWEGRNSGVEALAQLAPHTEVSL